MSAHNAGYECRVWTVDLLSTVSSVFILELTIGALLNPVALVI